MDSRFLNITDFAKMAGVSQPAITRQKNKGALAKAVVDGKIDTLHPVAVAYVQQQKAKQYQNSMDPVTRATSGPIPQPKPAKRTQTAVENKKDELLRHPAEYLDMTLRDIIVNYASIGDFKELLGTRKTIADITFKELQSEEKQGLLVRKEFVEKHVFGMLEMMNKRLLRDAVQAINVRLEAHYKINGDPQDGIEIVSEIIGKALTSTTNAIKHSLKKAREAA